jgi:glucose/arabinose dehydrogenase
MRNHALIALAILAGCSKKTPAVPAEAGPPDAIAVDALPHADCTPTSGSNITLRHIAKVDGVATLSTSPPNDARLFVLEEQGVIRIIEKEVLRAAPFLDVQNLIVAGGEQGLLGLAFDPNYATNRTFYIYYTAANPDTGDSHNPFVDVLLRYTTMAGDPYTADPTSAQIVLSIPDYAVNHNGGMLEFGSDGFLYLGLGDGGGAGDPDRNGQNPNALLAKILRLDVAHPSGGKQYGIPSDNPFAAGGGAGEVFIMGVRNPWRWSFDRATGDMWIGDVGQNVTEELDVLPAGQQNGKNLGWSVFEANSCCASQSDKCSQGGTQQQCDNAGKVFPQDTRDHGTGWNAIIGGQVYRGACFPDLQGFYYYTDNGHHGLSRAKLQPDNSLKVDDLGKCSMTMATCIAPTDCTGGAQDLCQLTSLWPTSPASLHANSLGEMFETTTSGDVYAFEAGP